MRKKVSEAQLAIRRDIVKKLKGFKEYFSQPTSKKMLYLEELAMYHFHKYAIRNTTGLGEYEYQKWIKTDEAFREAVMSIRQNFIDECEYMMLCRGGYYGPLYQKRYAHVDNLAMSSFVKVARGYGIFRRYSNFSGASKAGPAEGLSDGGQGESRTVGSPGSEGSVCSISETNSLP